MAGLYGFYDPAGKTDARERADRLEEVLSFSARERIDCRRSERSALGAIHLGLFPGGRRPVRDEATGTLLALDGEISEPEALAARLRAEGASIPADPSEPELLLRLFLEAGPEAFRDLDGSWAVAVLREERGEITLLTDRFGTRQIAWTLLPGGGVAFFPEAKGILAFPEAAGDLDPQGIAEMIAFQYILGRRTLIRGVEVLPPASIARFRNGRMEIRPYWSIPFPDVYPIVDEEEWVEEYVRLLRRSVEKRLRKPPVAGTTLSGGRDTRLIAAAAPRDLPELHTFTFGVPRCHDRRFARDVARAVGAAHHGVDLSPAAVAADLDRTIWFTDGMVTARHGHISILFPIVRNHVDLLLEGAPPASCFFYAFHVPGHNVITPVRKEAFLDYFLSLRMEVKPEEAEGVLAGPAAEAFREGPREAVRTILDGASPGFPALRALHLGLHNRFPRFTYAGARYMRLVMEVRQPFCDYALFDHAVTMPGKLFVDRNVYHRMVRRHFPEIAPIAHHSTGLPAEPSLARLFWTWRVERGKRWLANASGGRIRFRTRRRTFPYDEWMRGPFRERMTGDLRAPRLAALGVVDPKGVRRAVDEHFDGKRDRSNILWPLFTLENWARQFHGGEKPPPFSC